MDNPDNIIKDLGASVARTEHGAASFLGGHSETGRLIAKRDWSPSSLGPMEDWPQSLRTATAILLRSHVPMVMLWGEDGIMLYNDAYSIFAGRRHPELLGSKVRDGWPEVADFNDNVMKVGLAGGTLAYKDQELTLFRNGRAEQVWMNLDYSPVVDEAGKPAGVIAIVVETTGRVAAERQREAAEALLRAERDRARGVLENMAEGFLLLDRDLRVIDINAEGLRLEKRPREAILGGKHWEVWPGAEGSDLIRLYKRAIAERVPVAFENRYVWPDGHAAWLEVRGYPSADGLALFYRDVTERKVTEVRRTVLVELGDLIRDIDDPADLAYAAAELLGRTFEVSRAGYGTIDKAAETITIERDWTAPGIQSLAGTLHFRDYGSYIEDLKQGRTVVFADAEKDPRTAATAAALKAINAQAVINMPVTEQGNIVALIYLNHDTPREWSLADLALVREVAERTRDAVARRQAEVELRQSEARLRALNQSLEHQVAERTADRNGLWQLSRDLMLRCTLEGVVAAVNPAWTEVLGWRDDELTGTSLFDLIHPDDIERTVQGAEELSTGTSHTRFDNRYRCRDGSYRWISWSTRAGEGLINAVGRDVTAEKEQAEALAHAQEALRQAQKMEAVGQLTGGIAHDFNNLLTGVIGSLEMMQRRIAKGEMDRIEAYATAAMMCADRAAALTHRLLAFSRRQPLDPKPVNANQLVTGMEDMLRRSIGEAIRLEIVTDGELWRTLCDPHQLESAVLNLSINARDAMSSGGLLTIETRNAHLDSTDIADVKPGQYVRIRVIDTGTGMTPDVIAKAFDPFFTTKPIGQGTGLGLSMIYGFARQSEGYVKIDSEVGRGTAIDLYLPRYHGEYEEAEQPRGGLNERHRSDGEVVLVVEDEATVRDLVLDVLQELGYRAMDASDGPSALKLLLSDMRIDLLVTDVGLPGLNGRQLADQARHRRPDLKVLFMTGYAENATVAHGFLEPGMEMITKPFAIERLAARIRDIIEDGALRA